MHVGAVERLLRSLAAFEGLGGLEFRVPAEVSRWLWQQLEVSTQRISLLRKRIRSHLEARWVQ